MIERIEYKTYKTSAWPITQEIHEAIIRVYRNITGRGEVKALAKRLNYPRWKITRYAIQIGLIAKQKKEPNWTEKEIRILYKNAHHHPENIQKKLKKAGFNRSTTGIVLKRKRMRFTKNLEGMSATSLALCLGIDSHFVTKAIAAGKLKATKRGSKRTEKQGGDIYFIKDRDIQQYILTWLNEIDIRKVDKYWFCDILTMKKKS
jgi:hypothetical protein